MPLKDSENENVVTCLQLKYICVYVTANLCNQPFHEMAKTF